MGRCLDDIMETYKNNQMVLSCFNAGLQIEKMTQDCNLRQLEYDTWRYLTEAEIIWLMEMVKDSRK